MVSAKSNLNDLLTMEEAATRLPCPVSASSLYRWALRGIAGRRLRSVKIGGKRRVRMSDVEEFLAEVAGE